MPKFKNADVVTLRGQNQRMTVHRVETDPIVDMVGGWVDRTPVVWHDARGTLQEANFEAAVLQLVDIPEPFSL